MRPHVNSLDSMSGRVPVLDDPPQVTNSSPGSIPRRVHAGNKAAMAATVTSAATAQITHVRIRHRPVQHPKPFGYAHRTCTTRFPSAEALTRTIRRSDNAHRAPRTQALDQRPLTSPFAPIRSARSRIRYLRR